MSDIQHWLFLRGLSREQAHWGDFPERCERELGWTTLHLDLPGFGTERHRPSPLSVPAIRRDMQSRISALHEGPIGLIALSLGGMVALDWLVHDSSRIKKAVLINSSTADCPLRYRLRPNSILPTIKSLTSPSLVDQERRILAMVSNRADLNDTHTQWCDIRRQRPAHKMNVVRQLAAAARYRSPAVETLALHALFICSKGDRMVSWQCSEALANKYHCPIEFHSSAGHDLPLDDPDWLIAQLRKHC